MSASRIGIKDTNGVAIIEGHTVEVRVNGWNGAVTICKGKIEYCSNDLSSYGCGYAVVGEGKVTFLSSISRSHTEIEIVDVMEDPEDSGQQVMQF